MGDGNNDKIRVCPFTILVDNREKAPYPFANIPAQHTADTGKQLIVKTERQFLPTGDYSIDGHIDRIAIERKSLEDLYSTLGQHRERFEREMFRLHKMGDSVIVVEATWPMICKPTAHRNNWQSRLNPRSVYATILEWQRRYERVNWILAGSRRTGEILTFHILERFWERQKTKSAEAVGEKP